MGVLSNKIQRDQLRPGDHIYSWRHAYLYAHHGIYVGEGKVIHFTRGAGQEIGTGTVLDRIIFSSSPSHSLDNPCPKCGDQSSLDGVMSSCIDCFLSGGDLYLFEYGVNAAFFIAKARGGTCTLAPSDPQQDVLHRAFFLLQNGFGSYDIFKNNCEDFAIYCKTGLLVVTSISVGRSGQASSFLAAARSGQASSFLAAARSGQASSFLAAARSGQASSFLAAARSGQASSFLAAASAVASSPLRFLTTSFTGLGAVSCGVYCVSRLVSDIGIRRDVIKIPVERLTALLGLDEAEVGQRLPLKWSRRINLHA